MRMIKRVVRFEYTGREFTTLKAAEDHAENLAVQFFTLRLLDQGFTANECYKAAQVLIANRHDLLKLLGFGYTSEVDNEDQ